MNGRSGFHMDFTIAWSAVLVFNVSRYPPLPSTIDRTRFIPHFAEIVFGVQVGIYLMYNGGAIYTSYGHVFDGSETQAASHASVLKHVTQLFKPVFLH